MLAGLLRGRVVDPTVVAFICEDAALRERVKAALQDEGCRMLEAASGPALIPLLVMATPAVILIDERVVDPEPFELCGVMRDDPELSRIPLLLLGHRTSMEARRVAFYAGFADLLPVRCLRAELRARVGLRLELARLRQGREERRELAAG